MDVFLDLNLKKLLIYIVFVFLTSLFSYTVILFLNGSGLKYVPIRMRRFLFINADKSATGALQVGGIVFSIVSIVSITLLYEWYPYLISNHQYKIIACAYQSWIGILVYGYLDDCFEIRASIKLILQLAVIIVFCLRVSNVVFSENSALAFVVMMFFSIAIVNGSNLLDGLDTLTYKFSVVIYGSFIALAMPVNNVTTICLALTGIANMSGFLFYNRAPSKIHMGEIGVSSLGLSYIILATILFDGYKASHTTFEAFCYASLPCVLPFIELGVSFLRRILNGKSPFRGDKLHLHHILDEKHGHGPTRASSILALIYLSGIILAFFLIYVSNSYWGLLFLGFYTFGYYVLIGKKHWFGDEFKLSLSLLEKFLVKKEVRVMPSNSINDFKMVINPKSNVKKDLDS